MNLPKLSVDRLLDRKNPAVRAVLNLPEVKAAIDSAELRDLDARKLLAMERDAIRKGKYAKQRAAAAEALRKANEKAEKVKAELRLALQEQHAAYVADISITKTESSALADIEQQLIATANQRARDYWDCLDTLHNAVRTSLQCWVETGRDVIGRKIEKQGNNSKEMRAALSVLDDAMRDAEETRFMAISTADLTARLLAWNAKLAPALAEFDLKPPGVNADGVDPDFIGQFRFNRG